MSPHARPTPPSPHAQGELSRTPLAQVLMTCLSRALTGTVVLDIAPSEVRIHVDRGQVRAMELPWEHRSVRADVLPLFASPAPYRFYDVLLSRGPATPIECDTLHLILEGIREHASPAHVQSAFDRLGRDAPLLLHPERLPALMSLMHCEQDTLSILARPEARLTDLEPVTDDRVAVDRFVYFLIVVGALAPSRELVRSSAPPAARSDSFVRLKRTDSGRVPQAEAPPADRAALVEAHVAARRWMDAATLLDEMREESDEDPELHVRAAECYLAAGREANALHAVNAALHAHKRHERAHIVKALVVEKLGYLDRAKLHLEKALSINPRSERAQAELDRIVGDDEPGGLLSRFFK